MCLVVTPAGYFNQHVIDVQIVKLVVARAAIQGVNACAGIEHVVSGTAEQPIVTVAADK